MPKTWFRNNEGVTSPLGTALIIGISILLAGGVALMARVFTERSEETPPVSFAVDEQTDMVRVVHTDDGLRQSDFQIRIGAPGAFALDGPVQADSDELEPNVFVLLGGAEELAEGTTIHLCAEPASSDVRVEIRYISSNALLLRSEFRSLGDCPA